MTLSFREIREGAGRRLLRFEPIFWASIAARARSIRPKQVPQHQRANVALQTVAEWQSSQREVQALGLKPHVDGPKNWDGLIALDLILESLPSRSAAVLDAGAAPYSLMLPWLYWYGYRDLHGVNLIFEAPFSYGPIRYVPGDITRYPYPDQRFDAITCLSVIEHGVDVAAFLRDSYRILRPGGTLIVSCDYFADKIDTQGLTAYGVPVHVFDRPDIEKLIASARELGFEPTSPVALDCKDRPVHWKRLNLEFTFLLLAFRKPLR